MTIQRNGTIRTIVVIKHLGVKVKQLEVLLCYNIQNGIINEKENIIFARELKLFSINTIILLDTFQYVKTIKSNHKNIKVKNHST
jgi:hypothetical protein